MHAAGPHGLLHELGQTGLSLLAHPVSTVTESFSSLRGLALCGLALLISLCLLVMLLWLALRVVVAARRLLGGGTHTQSRAGLTRGVGGWSWGSPAAPAPVLRATMPRAKEVKVIDGFNVTIAVLLFLIVYACATGFGGIGLGWLFSGMSSGPTLPL